MQLQTQPTEGQTQILAFNPSTEKVAGTVAAGPLFRRIWPQAMIALGLGLSTAWVGLLESVREHQAGLQSFRSMRRIEARRKNASALRFRFSQSFASRRQRLSHAIVRSTIQRRGSTTNPVV